MKNFDLDNLERKNIYKTPEYLFNSIQNKVLNSVKNSDIETLERKNIFKTTDGLFENIQQYVLREINDFDVEKLEQKNIYQLPEDTFEKIQNHVLNEIKPKKKAKIISLKWGYAVAASLALIMGITFFNDFDLNSSKNRDVQNGFISNNESKVKESQIAYETLASDLTIIEKENKKDRVVAKPVASQVAQRGGGSVNRKKKNNIEDTQINEYLESFSNSEIAELVNNSNQDIYLDLYN